MNLKSVRRMMGSHLTGYLFCSQNGYLDKLRHHELWLTRLTTWIMARSRDPHEVDLANSICNCVYIQDRGRLSQMELKWAEFRHGQLKLKLAANQRRDEESGKVDMTPNQVRA